MTLPLTDLRHFFNQVTYRDFKYPYKAKDPSRAEDIAHAIDARLAPVVSSAEPLVFESAPSPTYGALLHVAKTSTHVIEVLDLEPTEKGTSHFDYDESILLRRELNIYERKKTASEPGAISMTLQPDMSPFFVHLWTADKNFEPKLDSFTPRFPGEATQKTCDTIDALVRKINAAAPVPEWLQNFDALFERAQNNDIYKKGRAPGGPRG